MTQVNGKRDYGHGRIRDNPAQRQRYELVEKLREEGHTYAAIGHVLGVTAERVRQMWNKVRRVKQRGGEW